MTDNEHPWLQEGYTAAPITAYTVKCERCEAEESPRGTTVVFTDTEATQWQDRHRENHLSMDRLAAEHQAEIDSFNANGRKVRIGAGQGYSRYVIKDAMTGRTRISGIMSMDEAMKHVKDDNLTVVGWPRGYKPASQGG